ncbi:hypothetical protein ACWDYH_10510 [Nocardia goodfellowii]
MPPLFGTSTSYRLARIAALIVGSLLFLYACERSKSSMFSDVWVEILLAAAFGMAGIGAAWFEIMMDERSARNGNTGTEDLRYETDDRVIRGRIARSGNLVLHGRDLESDYEWSWTFRPAAFPAIRAALGDDGSDLLRLLEKVIPQLDRHGRADPGAWLRAQQVPGTYREKGDNPTEVTRELPVLKAGLPRAASTRSRAVSSETSRQSTGSTERQDSAAAERPRSRTTERQPTGTAKRRRTRAGEYQPTGTTERQRTEAAEPQRSSRPASARGRRLPPLEPEAEPEIPPRRSRAVPDQQVAQAARKRPSLDYPAPARRTEQPLRADADDRRNQHIPDARDDAARRGRRSQPDLPPPRTPGRAASTRRDRLAYNDSDRNARRGQAVTDRPVQVPLNRLAADADYDAPRATPSRARRNR